MKTTVMTKLLQLSVVLILILTSCSNNTSFKVETTPLKTPTQASLRGLFVLDENTVWASGAESTVIRTLDGGQNWQTCFPDSTLKNDFRSIHAWNEKEALVFGISGPDFAYRTTDGGTNWQVVYSDTTSGLFFNSVKFADPNTGLAVSDPIDGQFFVLKTSDAGKTWKRITNLPPTQNGEANFAASNTCIEFLPDGHAWIASGGTAARVFYSSDFGETWQVSSTPMLQGDGPKGIYSITFSDAKNGIITGGIYNQPEVNADIAAYTTDGGLTWNKSETMPAGFRSCVQIVRDAKNSFAMAMGKTGHSLSFDGGKNWVQNSEIGYYTFRAVPGELIAYAAGAEGKMIRMIITVE